MFETGCAGHHYVSPNWKDLCRSSGLQSNNTFYPSLTGRRLSDVRYLICTSTLCVKPKELEGTSLATLYILLLAVIVSLTGHTNGEVVFSNSFPFSFPMYAQSCIPGSSVKRCHVWKLTD